MNTMRIMQTILRSYNIMVRLESALERELTEADGMLMMRITSEHLELSNQEIVDLIVKELKAA